MKNKDLPAAQRGTLAPIKYLGAPALIEGDDKAAYYALHDKIVDFVKPKDVFEEILVREIVDLQWETMRYRRLKAALMSSDLYIAVRDMLLPICGVVEASKISDGCAKRDPEAMARLKEILASVGVSMDVLNARTLARRINDVERIDRLAENAELRRTRALRELEKHRSGLAKILRGAIVDVEEGEYKEIKEDGPVTLVGSE